MPDPVDRRSADARQASGELTQREANTPVASSPGASARPPRLRPAGARRRARAAARPPRPTPPRRRPTPPTRRSTRSSSPDANRHPVNRQDRHDGAVRAVVRRPAAVPVAVVRRHAPVHPAGLPVRGRVPRRRASSPTRPTCGSPACRSARWSAKQLDPQGNRTLVTIQMDDKFAPIHRDARAILRTKTILGETYVQLTPGTPRSPYAARRRRAAARQRRTRGPARHDLQRARPTDASAFRQWQQELAVAVKGNDQNLNERARQPARRSPPTRPTSCRCSTSSTPRSSNLVRNGGTVFAAIGHNQSALRNLITSAEATFATTAANNNAIIQTFHVFPTFLNETKATMAAPADLRGEHRPAGRASSSRSRATWGRR